MRRVILRTAAALLLGFISAQALEGPRSPPSVPAEPIPRIDCPSTGPDDDASSLRLRSPGATEFGSLADLFSRTVYPEFWGAKGDGRADDAPALLAAGDSLGGRCGTVQLAPGKRYRIGSAFRLPRCVTVSGTATLPDDPHGHQTSLFGAVGGLLIDPAATIILNSSAGITNLYVVQDGLTLPAPDSAAFAGTAFACAIGMGVEPETRSNGPFLRDVLVIGFERALDCRNTDRPRIERFAFDSINGIHAHGSFDTSIFDRVRGWPYASVGFGGWAATGAKGDGRTATVTFTPASTLRAGTQVTITGMGRYDGAHPISASTPGSVSFVSAATGAATGGGLTDTDHSLSRPGTAFDFDGQQDDTHVTHALAFGYTTGFNFRANGNILGDMLWSDNVPRAAPGSAGFRFGGPIGRTAFGKVYAYGSTFAVQFSAQTGAPLHAGVDVAELFAQTDAPGGECVNASTTAPAFLNIQSLNIAGCASWAVNVSAAPNLRMSIGGGTIIRAQNGRTDQPYIALPRVGGNRGLIRIDDANLRTDQAVGTALFGNGAFLDSTIAAASSLALPASGVDTLAISGDATVTTITGAFGGREMLFVCTGACSFANGGNIAMRGRAPFIGAAGAMIKFRYDANNVPTLWREEWRTTP